MILSKRQKWAIGAAVVILGLWLWNRIGPPPPETIGDMEANHPWMVINPTLEQGRLPSAYTDKYDSNVLYLVFVGENGSALKVDLQNKGVTVCRFKSDQGDPAITVPYYAVHNRSSGGSLSIPGKDSPREKIPIWDEIRGRTEIRRVSHMFGYPFANKPGERTATLQTGYWYVMDERNGRKVELLRLKVKNSELTGGDSIGDMDLSPNKRWIVFSVANQNPRRVFIFDRESRTPEAFQ